jgi:hypothetical protein
LDVKSSKQSQKGEGTDMAEITEGVLVIDEGNDSDSSEDFGCCWTIQMYVGIWQ